MIDWLSYLSPGGSTVARPSEFGQGRENEEISTAGSRTRILLFIFFFKLKRRKKNWKRCWRRETLFLLLLLLCVFGRNDCGQSAVSRTSAHLGTSHFSAARQHVEICETHEFESIIRLILIEKCLNQFETFSRAAGENVAGRRIFHVATTTPRGTRVDDLIFARQVPPGGLVSIKTDLKLAANLHIWSCRRGPICKSMSALICIIHVLEEFSHCLHEICRNVDNFCHWIASFEWNWSRRMKFFQFLCVVVVVVVVERMEMRRGRPWWFSARISAATFPSCRRGKLSAADTPPVRVTATPIFFFFSCWSDAGTRRLIWIKFKLSTPKAQKLQPKCEFVDWFDVPLPGDWKKWIFEFKKKRKKKKIWKKFWNLATRAVADLNVWLHFRRAMVWRIKLEFNFVEILEEIWAANLNFPLETIEDRFCEKNDGNNFF